MCKGKSSTQTKASLVFVKYGKYGATPTMHVQGQIKFKWACLIKHLADADIPNARLSAKPKLNSNLCFLESILKQTLKKRFKGASPNQKLLNLWMRTQANNLEHGAMPNISLTLKLPLFCLGAIPN